MAGKYDQVALERVNTAKKKVTLSGEGMTPVSFEIAAPSNNDTSDMSLNTSLDLDPEGGADIHRANDVKDSDYFYHADFYSMKSTDTLTLLPNFKTYQQTNESSCGVCSSLMVLNYFGKLGNETEKTLSDMRTKGDNPGSSLKQLISIFDKVGGFTLDSTYDHLDSDGNPDDAFFGDEKGLSLIEGYLKRGIPVIVGWNDWGGHWETIIGYDTMGTDSYGDDVLIVADSYDTTDHCQDGYGVYGAERFYYNWTFYDFFKGSVAEKERDYIYLAAVPTGVETFTPASPSFADDRLNQDEAILDVTKSTSTTSDTYTVTFQDGSKKDVVLEASHSNFSKEMNANTAEDMQKEGGADLYDNAGDHDSTYFYHKDFYHQASTSTLTLLPSFKTYQQTSEGSCGVVSFLNSLRYLGLEGDWTEKKLWDARSKGTNHGTSLKQLVSLAKQVPGLKYESTQDHLKDDGTADSDYFNGHMADFFLSYLKKDMPVIVGWNDWGGHWQTVIGYDTMGTETTGDDVLIVADSYDTTDHCQDGYGVYGYERFFYNWTFYDFFAGSDAASERDFSYLALGK